MKKLKRSLFYFIASLLAVISLCSCAGEETEHVDLKIIRECPELETARFCLRKIIVYDGTRTIVRVWNSKWDAPYAGYIYREKGEVCKDIFSPPMLLIKETVNTQLESVSAIATQQLVFTDKITSVKLHCDNDLDIYRIISCLINSSLFAYYIQQHSSRGVSGYD